MDCDEPGLVRYWFEFDLSDHEPRGDPDGIRLDGGTTTHRLLWRGAGVTGYDKSDCLHLLRDAVGEDLPPLRKAERNPSIDDGLAREIGNVAWRGVWMPRLNMSGPTIG